MNGQASHVLRWPLWSWRNLTVTAAAALLVLYGIGRVAESAGTTPANTTTAKTTTAKTTTAKTTTAKATTANTTETSPATSPASAGADSNSVTTLAIAFAQAWSSSGRSAQEWTRGIQPFVTSALAAGLAHTDPARVPATKVTGEAELLTASATSAAVRVPTDGGSIVVTVHRTSSGPWQVSDVGPSGQPPGAPTPDLRPRPSPTPG